MPPRALALAAALVLPALSGAPARAELGGALDRPDLLAYSSFPPRSEGYFLETTAYAGGLFQGNLSDVHTTSDPDLPAALPLFVSGYGGGFSVGGAGAQLLFVLDEPDTIQRNAKKIKVQQKAWLSVAVEGIDGAAAPFEAGPVDLESCSAKATFKDKSGNGAADEGSLKVKCKSVDELIQALGLTGAAADTVRSVFGTKKATIKLKDGDGPSAPAP
jgi:hypothetical protein